MHSRDVSRVLWEPEAEIIQVINCSREVKAISQQRRLLDSFVGSNKKAHLAERIISGVVRLLVNCTSLHKSIEAWTGKAFPSIVRHSMWLERCEKVSEDKMSSFENPGQ